MTRLSSSISWFGLVGALAALDHYLVALIAKNGLAFSPAWANVAGFCCAFPLSYFGHRNFSFPDQHNTHWQAFPRFFFVALTGFFANQFLLLMILHHTHVPFWLALALVMVVVAVSSYLLSRYWAFSHV